jgi:hypothetical protein
LPGRVKGLNIVPPVGHAEQALKPNCRKGAIPSLLQRRSLVAPYLNR